MLKTLYRICFVFLYVCRKSARSSGVTWRRTTARSNTTSSRAWSRHTAQTVSIQYLTRFLQHHLPHFIIMLFNLNNNRFASVRVCVFGVNVQTVGPDVPKLGMGLDRELGVT